MAAAGSLILNRDEQAIKFGTINSNSSNTFKERSQITNFSTPKWSSDGGNVFDENLTENEFGEIELASDIRRVLYKRLPCLIKLKSDVTEDPCPQNPSSLDLTHNNNYKNQNELQAYTNSSFVNDDCCNLYEPMNRLANTTATHTTLTDQRMSPHSLSADNGISTSQILLYAPVNYRKIFGICELDKPILNLGNEKLCDIVIPESYEGWFRVDKCLTIIPNNTSFPNNSHLLNDPISSAPCFQTMLNLCDNLSSNELRETYFLSVIDVMGYYLVEDREGTRLCQNMDYTKSRAANKIQSRQTEQPKLSKFYKHYVPKGTVLRIEGLFYEAESPRVRNFTDSASNVSPIPTKLVNAGGNDSGNKTMGLTGATKYVKCRVVSNHVVGVPSVLKTLFIPLHRKGKFYLVWPGNFTIPSDSLKSECKLGAEDVLSSKYLYSIRDIVGTLSPIRTLNEATVSSGDTGNSGVPRGNMNHLKFKHVVGSLPASLMSNKNDCKAIKHCLTFTFYDIETPSHESIIACNDPQNPGERIRLFEIDMKDSRLLMESEAEILVDNRALRGNYRQAIPGITKRTDSQVQHDHYIDLVNYCQINVDTFLKSIKLIKQL